MKIYTEMSLSSFEFWSGAEIIANELTDEQLYTIEQHLEEQYPDGMDDEELNDLFRFEEDYIAQILGYADWEEFMHKDDEDEEEIEKWA